MGSLDKTLWNLQINHLSGLNDLPDNLSIPCPTTWVHCEVAILLVMYDKPP